MQLQPEAVSVVAAVSLLRLDSRVHAGTIRMRRAIQLLKPPQAAILCKLERAVEEPGDSDKSRVI